VGDIIYTGFNEPGCNVIANGWYTSQRGNFENYVYHVVDGVVIEIDSCNPTTTTTTTTIP
jgi:hypothetical protein